jgi:ammonia channel protein AmtB
MSADDPVAPSWLNNGDNAWQLTAASLVGLQSIPGLVIIYAGKSASVQNLQEQAKQRQVS